MRWRMKNGDEPRQQKRAKKHDAARPSACHGRGRRDVDSSRPRGLHLHDGRPVRAGSRARRSLPPLPPIYFLQHACPIGSLPAFYHQTCRLIARSSAQKAELSTKARRRALSTRLSKRHGAATRFRVRPGAVGDATFASQCHAFRALAHAGASHFQHTSGNDCIRPACGGWGCR